MSIALSKPVHRTQAMDATPVSNRGRVDENGFVILIADEDCGFPLRRRPVPAHAMTAAATSAVLNCFGYTRFIPHYRTLFKFSL